MPAPIAAWRAGFCPAPAVRIWPSTTSLTSAGSTFVRSSAALIATCPRWEAGTVLSDPLNAPTGVRAAPAITTSVMTGSFLSCGLAPRDGSVAAGRSAWRQSETGWVRNTITAKILHRKMAGSISAAEGPPGRFARRPPPAPFAQRASRSAVLAQTAELVQRHALVGRDERVALGAIYGNGEPHRRLAE